MLDLLVNHEESGTVVNNVNNNYSSHNQDGTMHGDKLVNAAHVTNILSRLEKNFSIMFMCNYRDGQDSL